MNELKLIAMVSTDIPIVCLHLVCFLYFQTGRLPRFEDVLDGIADLPSKCEVEPAVANSSA